MRRHYWALTVLIPIVSATMGCSVKGSSRGEGPTLKWILVDTTKGTKQTFSQTQAAHVAAGSTYILSVEANAPAGLSAMSLEGHGTPICGASDGGGILSTGNHPVTFPPQISDFNSRVTNASLAVTDFNFLGTDCHFTVGTDRGEKEATALKGTITFAATASDISQQEAAGVLQLSFP